MFKLYIGNEPYLSLREALNLVIQVRESQTAEYISIDAEKTDPSVLIDTLSSQNLFSPQRIILLKRVYRNKNKDVLITFLLEHLPNNRTDTIIIWEDQKVSSVTKYVKFFKSQNLLEEYNQLNKRTFQTWAKQEVDDMNLKLDSNTIRLLAEYSNYDPERFGNNLKKIKLLDKELVTQEDIKDIAPYTLEDDIWTLLDQINSSDRNTLLTLERVLKQGIDANYVIAMIARNLRLLTMIKSLKEKGAVGNEIASILRIPPFTVPSLSKASDRYTMDKLKYIYEKICSLDYEIKVGRISGDLGLTVLCTIL